MKIQLIRNAAMKINYAGRVILTDPMLSSKGEIRSFAGKEKNPIIDLPISIKEILSNVDAVLVSHTHPDHFDDAAANATQKSTPIICTQNDTKFFKEYGFENITEIIDEINYDNINIIRTNGQHGSGAILERMGEVSGFVFSAENEPTVYWVGDSILYQEVIDNIKKYNPKYIITHSGGAVIPGFEPILMNLEQTISLAEQFPDIKVIAVHFESLDHCTVSRKSLAEAAKQKNIQNILIPNDGETIEFD